MKTNNVPKPEPIGVEAFVDAVNNPNITHDELQPLQSAFLDEWVEASSGRLLTPDRMAKMYPVLREINIEAEEIEAEERRALQTVKPESPS